MSNLVGLNVGLSDSLAAKTRRFADYYRQLANGTIKEVYDAETVNLYSGFYRSNVEKVTFPNCRVIVGNEAFGYCEKLFSVDFPELVQMGTGTFRGTAKLVHVCFPKVGDVITSAFNRSSVETVDFPVCTWIRDTVFSYCSKLKEIKIPICKVIGRSVFLDCTALEKIFLNGVESVPTLGTDALKGTPDTLKIIVPDALVDSFKTATNWSAYADKIVGISEYNAAT